MAKKNNVQYYTMITEKYMDILKGIQQDQIILADLLKDSVTSVNIEDWELQETNDLLETYVVVNSFKKLLEGKLRDPPKEEVAFAKQHGITDVLITEDELYSIQRFVASVNEQKDILAYDHKINLTLH
jgi:hypothetical protein